MLAFSLLVSISYRIIPYKEINWNVLPASPSTQESTVNDKNRAEVREKACAQETEEQIALQKNEKGRMLSSCKKSKRNWTESGELPKVMLQEKTKSCRTSSWKQEPKKLKRNSILPELPDPELPNLSVPCTKYNCLIEVYWLNALDFSFLWSK